MYTMCYCWKKTPPEGGQVDKKALPKSEKVFEVGDDKEYEVKTIIDCAVYG